MKHVGMFLSLFVFLCLGMINLSGFAIVNQSAISDSTDVTTIVTIATEETSVIPKKKAKIKKRNIPKKKTEIEEKDISKKKAEAKKKIVMKKKVTKKKKAEVKKKVETKPKKKQSLSYDVNANIDGKHYLFSDFMYNGEYYDSSGYRFTYYSETVLPGGALRIPGRHVNNEGYVCDADGNICLASRDFEKGKVVKIPFGDGIGKVYDECDKYGTFDLYVHYESRT